MWVVFTDRKRKATHNRRFVKKRINTFMVKIAIFAAKKPFQTISKKYCTLYKPNSFSLKNQPSKKIPSTHLKRNIVDI